MPESATSTRASKRLLTSRRIMRSAIQLTLEHGLDGWTMENLAEASGVSRRTLFNYYPTKLDAVVGPSPELPPEMFEAFRAGLPTGDLMDDCRVLARALLSEEQFAGQDLRLQRRLMVQVPRLLVVAHERFEVVAGQLVDHILAREGEQFGAHRARLLIRLMVALFDGCLDQLAEDGEERPMADLFDEALDTVRELLA